MSKKEFDGMDCASNPDKINMTEQRKGNNTMLIKGKIINTLVKFQKHKEKFFEKNKETLYRL
jgi:hypothetical protein